MCEVVPATAVVPAFQAGTRRHYRGITTLLWIPSGYTILTPQSSSLIGAVPCQGAITALKWDPELSWDSPARFRKRRQALFAALNSEPTVRPTALKREYGFLSP